MADEHSIGLQPGTVIATRYEVVKCLGAGSMGMVYACRHKELGHLVAVKVLFPEVAQDKIAAARFRNEITASYGVSHPNVVRAYEYIREGDLVAYTMEYVSGGDLAERLGRREQIPIPEIIRILAQMCSGVQAIHDAGIVHRDLKPENIFLTKENYVKIGDFGIARTGHGQRLTEHGGVVGTIDYVSPEYMLNSQVDWRSDIYALGILGYEMIVGESPFRGDSVYATMTLRLKSDPKFPSASRSDCPVELDRIVLRAMHRTPELRYQSAAEMAKDLAALAANLGIVIGPGSSSRFGNSLGGPTSQDINYNTSIESEQKDRVPDVPQSTRGAPLSSRPVGDFVVKSAAANSLEDYGSGTETFPPEIIDIGNEFDERGTIHEPIRMEPLLKYNDMVSEGWTTPQPNQSPEIKMHSGTVDDNRLRRLSQLVDKVNRSIWVDVVTLIVAVMIGVGVGFAFLRVFFPELLSHRATPVPKSFDIRALSDD